MDCSQRSLLKALRFCLHLWRLGLGAWQEMRTIHQGTRPKLSSQAPGQLHMGRTQEVCTLLAKSSVWRLALAHLQTGCMTLGRPLLDPLSCSGWGRGLFSKNTCPNP